MSSENRETLSERVVEGTERWLKDNEQIWKYANQKERVALISSYLFFLFSLAGVTYSFGLMIAFSKSLNEIYGPLIKFSPKLVTSLRAEEIVQIFSGHDSPLLFLAFFSVVTGASKLWVDVMRKHGLEYAESKNNLGSGNRYGVPGGKEPK